MYIILSDVLMVLLYYLQNLRFTFLPSSYSVLKIAREISIGFIKIHRVFWNINWTGDIIISPYKEFRGRLLEYRPLRC